MEFLTRKEHELVELLGKAFDLFGEIAGNGKTRSADMGEICGQIHVLQSRVLMQSSARAYPDKYRLLGEQVPGKGEP